MTFRFDANKNPFSWWQILIFVVVFFTSLFILFPKKLFEQRLLEKNKPTDASVTYLHNLLLSDPDNTKVRITLAEQQLEVGQAPEAKKNVLPYLTLKPQSMFEWRVLWIFYQVTRIEAFKLQPKNPVRTKKETILRNLQVLLAKSPYLSIKEKIQLADDALATDQPKIANYLYKQVNNLSKDLPISFYDKAGKTALFVKDYGTSAEFYRLAMEKSKKFRDKRYYFFKAVNSLVAEGSAVKGLQFAQKNAKQLLSDRLTRYFLTQLALKAGRPDMAEQYLNPLLVTTDQAKLYEFELPLNNDEDIEKVRLIKFNKKLYELAYVVYLQNRNIKKGYTIATAAVKQVPESREWRERLAEVAIWNQEPVVALDQYYYLVEHFEDRKADVKGIDLSKKIHDPQKFVFFVMFDIQHGNSSAQNWQEYVNAMLNLGEISELIGVLSKNKQLISKTIYLNSLVTIYTITDQPEEKLKTLIQLSQVVGMTPEIALNIAKINILQGNFTEANKIMNQAVASPQPKSAAFWTSYRKMGGLVDNKKEQLYAAQQLLKEKDPPDNLYTILVQLTYKSDPKLAYQYIQAGLTQHRDDVYLNTAWLAMMAANQSLDFPKFVADTPKPVLVKLKQNDTYWLARSNYWRHVGNKREILLTYLTGMKYIPDNNYFKSDFMLYLIEQNEFFMLKKVVDLWQKQSADTEEFWGPYAQAYARFDNPTMTRLYLSLFYDQFREYDKNIYWLIIFKDTLENAFFEDQSKQISVYTWPLYLNMIKKQTKPLSYIDKLNYVKLSMLNAFGDPTAIGLANLEQYTNEDVELLMLTWAIGHNNISQAQAIYWHYKLKGIEPPLWTQLSIALARYHLQDMRRILTDGRPIASYRDKINAAIKINALPLAQTYSFKALKTHRKDQNLYDYYFKPAMLKTADSFYLGQDYYQYGNVAGPRTNAYYEYFLMPSLSLTPYNSTWLTRNLPNKKNPGDLSTTTNQVLKMVPDVDERTGIRLNTLHRHGKFTLDLGYRSDLNSVFNAKVTETYATYTDLDLTGIIGFHQPADDTAGLLVGGMKNNVDLNFNYRMFAGDNLVGELKQNFFYTQQGQYLADGTQVNLRVEHKLWKDYPDWSLIPYGVMTQYYGKTTASLTGSILKIVPDNVQPNVNFLIPKNFVEYGLTLSFGQNYIDEYTFKWRPFGSGTVSNSTVVGLGESFNIGLTGALFGRDHLLIYYEWASNQGQGIQMSQLAKISYRIYI